MAARNITVHSSFIVDISTFDNEDAYKDVFFVIPGFDKPLHLHRKELGLASTTIEEAFKGMCNKYLVFDERSKTLTWIYGRGEIDMTFFMVLLKWLRFFYGEDQTFSLDECPAALLIFDQLQVKTKPDVNVRATIAKHMMESVKNDVDTASRLLLGFAVDDSQVNKELAEFVLTYENMKAKPEIVEECLMMLPASYLDLVRYSSVPGELSEHRIRWKFVKYNSLKLSAEKKRAIMMNCKQGIMEAEEIEEIRKEGIMSEDDINELWKRGLKTWKSLYGEERMRKEGELFSFSQTTRNN